MGNTYVSGGLPIDKILFVVAIYFLRALNTHQKYTPKPRANIANLLILFQVFAFPQRNSLTLVAEPFVAARGNVVLELKEKPLS